MTQTPLFVIDCTEHLAEVRDFADRTNQRAQLEEQLTRLVTNKPEGCVICLYKDFALYSFYFDIRMPNGERYMNGGLIYHGELDGFGNGGAPTFSVCLTPTAGWSIHT